MVKKKVDDGRPKCSVCNKPLSNPKSVERGIGPVCWAALKKKEMLNEAIESTKTVKKWYRDYTDTEIPRKSLKIVIEGEPNQGMSSIAEAVYGFKHRKEP